MQKLVWQNANGDEINLTGGNYGITEWEGFSNASLNIQNQQVPFQDGAVFLDALIEPRELSVTLKMQDKGNLKERYRMRRELVHILNPKLGEGYLIYTNDFISKRIKCIPQIPLFETHNSDTRGTPKASLAWTACEPYWEDLEETKVLIEATQSQNVENQGDLPCQIEMNWYASDVTNGKVVNETQNQFIKYNGELNENLKISTKFGTKSVVVEKIGFEIGNLGNIINDIIYVEKLGSFFAVGSYYIIIKSKDGVNWEEVMKTQEFTNAPFYGICYSEEKELFVAVGYGGAISTSSDGINWTQRTSGVTTIIYDVDYSKTLGKFIAVDGTNILTSSDGINWEKQVTTYEPRGIACFDNINIITGNNGEILTSTDGVNWTLRTSGVNTSLYSIAYAESLNLYIICGANGIILTSQDAIVWNSQTSGVSAGLRKIIYSKQRNIIIVVGANGIILTSQDGVIWVEQDSNTTLALYTITYSIDLGLFVACGLNGKIITSSIGTQWEQITVGFTSSSAGHSYYGKNLFFVVGTSGLIATSSDGEKWTLQESGTTNALYDVVYSKKLDIFIAVGYAGTILSSQDGITWTPITSGVNYILESIIYSEKLQLFVIAGSYNGNGKILTSQNGTVWTEQNVGNIPSLFDVTYSEEKELFVACGNEETILTSTDGINWNDMQILQDGYVINAIIYVNELNIFIAVGTHIFTSEDGINWIDRPLPANVGEYKYSIAWAEEMHLLVVPNGYNYLISTNGIFWTVKPTNYDMQVSRASYSPKLDKLVFTGTTGLILYSKYEQKESRIQYISSDSDMGMNLGIGNNKLSVNSSNLSVLLKYRQKYLGV